MPKKDSYYRIIDAVDVKFTKDKVQVPNPFAPTPKPVPKNVEPAKAASSRSKQDDVSKPNRIQQPSSSSDEGTPKVQWEEIYKNILAENKKLKDQITALETEQAQSQAELQKMETEKKKLSDKRYQEGMKAGELLGQKKGKKAGIEEGEKIGYSKGLEEIDKALILLKSATEKLQKTHETLLLQGENELVRLAIAVAKRVVQDLTTMDESFVQRLAGEVLRSVVDKEKVVLRVNAADYQLLKEAKGDLLTYVDGIRQLEIEEDVRVGKGGCIVETGSGIIDARLATQLEEISRKLLQKSGGD